MTDDDVLGLNIAVNDPAVVRRHKSRGDLDGDIDHLWQRDWSGGYRFSKGAAINIFGGEEVYRFCAPEIIDGEDVGVIQGGDSTCLFFKAVQPDRVAAEFFRQQLDDHLSAQPQVLSKEDLAHSTKTQTGADLVFAKRRAHRQLWLSR